MLNALNFEMEMTKHGVNVVYAKEEFGNSAAGRFALRTMMSVNQFYSENLGEDIKRTQADNAQSCRANGPAPYGYKSGPDGRFVIDEERAGIVREIYARYADMESIASIARDLNARGIKNSLGNDWGRSSFKNIIGNERYKGIYIFDGTRIDGGMPRIIDDDTFDEAVRAMHAKGGRKNPASDYQLTGKMQAACDMLKNTVLRRVQRDDDRHVRQEQKRQHVLLLCMFRAQVGERVQKNICRERSNRDGNRKGALC